MDKVTNKRMNFIKRFYKAIVDFDSYSTFSEESIKYAIKYIAILVTIISLLTSIACIIKSKSEISNGIKYISETVNEIKIENGKLSYNNNEMVVYENESSILPTTIIDTSDEPNLEEIKKNIGLYNIGIIILKDKIELYPSNELQSNSVVYDFDKLLLSDMNKEEILSMFNNNSLFILMGIIIFIVEFIQQFIYILSVSVILALIGIVFAFTIRIKITFKSGYKIGLYALTLPVVLEFMYFILNMYTGFIIKYFDWMYTTISYIYVCVAILMIKIDFINFQRKMIRIKSDEELIEEEKKKKEIEEEQEQEENEEDTSDMDDDIDKDNDLKEQTDN